MGTLVGVMGDVSIPKEHWETYAAQMLTVLTQGGMMQYDTIQLYGKNIMLIHKPEFDTDRGVVEWQYNYIENDYWEPCTMDASGWLTTGKVGQNQFRNVMQAAYRAAKDTMNTILNGAKLPKIEALKKSCRELAGQKKELYAEYREAQRQMREAVAIKANIDHLLGITDERENKAQER